MIFKYGDPAVEVYFIVKGRVISKCQDVRGREKTHVYVEGSFFGEADILMKRSRVATTRAETDCEIWKVNKDDFIKLLHEFPDVKDEIIELIRVKELNRIPVRLTF